MLCMLKNEGYTHFSLGLAALAGVGTESDATLQERAVHQIYEHMNRFFSYKGLRNYKAKFDPEWVSRYLVYEESAPGLVRTTIAIAKATED
jgi:phosphatidylglycerol lysyltransferase